jgi:hypothetical protein
MQYPTSVSIHALSPRNIIGSTTGYRKAGAARLETGKPRRGSAITREAKATWSKALSGFNHPAVYTSPVGCSL